MGTHRGEAGIVASLVVHGLGENSRVISERLVTYGLTIAHPAQGVGIASAVALIPLSDGKPFRQNQSHMALCGLRSLHASKTAHFRAERQCTSTLHDTPQHSP